MLLNLASNAILVGHLQTSPSRMEGPEVANGH